MPRRDIVAWNSMLTGFISIGDMENTFDLFTRMPHRNVFSWNLMLRGYIQQNDINTA
ncbi:pentatricopeptide repeat-containing protein at1g32415 mitochondrial [Phtheirospermum japonicum]|uniref:Pentatricopeptide repeat-containing protein at1g32415 mitochondrial n=1 Tax=Phtheirospermum japonicum TaxID=374723 RepID=A0A830CQL6_9LAMI|nr:pentatricopeptide repeat-containing protein at1g32415 mitochondrial [Phtheirospermum japonicum]